MDDVLIAGGEADSAAVQAVRAHHVELAGALRRRAEAVFEAAAHADTEGTAMARDELVSWSRAHLLPHAVAEEAALYRAGREDPAGRLLVEAMLAEHERIGALVAELEVSYAVTDTVGLARALDVLFGEHVRKEEDQLLALLVANPDVAVAPLVEGLHGS